MMMVMLMVMLMVMMLKKVEVAVSAHVFKLYKVFRAYKQRQVEEQICFSK